MTTGFLEGLVEVGPVLGVGELTSSLDETGDLNLSVTLVFPLSRFVCRGTKNTPNKDSRDNQRSLYPDYIRVIPLPGESPSSITQNVLLTKDKRETMSTSTDS